MPNISLEGRERGKKWEMWFSFILFDGKRCLQCQSILWATEHASVGLGLFFWRPWSFSAHGWDMFRNLYDLLTTPHPPSLHLSFGNTGGWFGVMEAKNGRIGGSGGGKPSWAAKTPEIKEGPVDFPGGPVDKNPPANAGDTDSIPGLRRSHLLWNNQAWALKLVKPVYLQPVLRSKRSHHKEKPTYHKEEQPPLCN